MGYHLAILRTEGATARPIGRAELLAALPSMGARLAPDADSAALQLIDPARGQDSPLLCFGADGELWSSSPDPAFIALMIELAALLGARARRRVRKRTARPTTPSTTPTMGPCWRKPDAPVRCAPLEHLALARWGWACSSCSWRASSHGKNYRINENYQFL
ncbi:hypothetical protein LP420_24830 [Massilia sp. B-10]|nr:hypothetical protein LP420_24830 [Massilia sp. B-10]